MKTDATKEYANLMEFRKLLPRCCRIQKSSDSRFQIPKSRFFFPNNEQKELNVKR
jgi:hypothetical protein